MNYAEISANTWHKVNAPSADAARDTACIQAAQERSGAITLLHNDGTTVRAEWPDPPELDELAEDWAAMVKAVEAQAKKETDDE